MIIRTPCPMCHEEGMEMRNTPLDLPYFGEALQITIICKSCNYRHSDMQLFGQKEAVRYTLRGASEADLRVRVVRSASGTMRVPELGIEMEPGMASEGYVTNVEGVLERFAGVVEVALNGLDRSGAPPEEVAEKKARALGLLERIVEMRAAREEYTLILEDPMGNSAILAPSAKKEVLGPEEAARLKSGYFEIDISDADGGGGGGNGP